MAWVTGVAGAAEPAAGSGGDYGGLLWSSLLALVGVCVVAYVVVRVARRAGLAGRPASRELLDVVARVPLEPRRSLYVVDVAGKALLVGTSEMGLTVLTELDRDEVHARAAVRGPSSFAELVRQAVARRRAPPVAAPAQASERALDPPRDQP